MRRWSSPKFTQGFTGRIWTLAIYWIDASIGPLPHELHSDDTRKPEKMCMPDQHNVAAIFPKDENQPTDGGISTVVCHFLFL